MKSLPAVALLLALPLGANAQEQDTPEYKADYAECMKGGFPDTSSWFVACMTQRSNERLDKELNKQYQAKLKSMDKYAYSKRAKPKLVAAERAWITYRDKTCNFENDIGGISGTPGQECVERMTKERIEYLKDN